MLESGSVVQALKDMTPNYVSQAMVFAALWKSRDIAPGPASQRETVALIAKGMQLDEADVLAQQEHAIANYRRGLERLAAAGQALRFPAPLIGKTAADASEKPRQLVIQLPGFFTLG